MQLKKIPLPEGHQTDKVVVVVAERAGRGTTEKIRK